MLQTIRKRGEQNVRARGIMAGLPINIPIPAEQAVASYDYQDIINGFGIVEFKASATTTSTTTLRNLNNNVIQSDPVSAATSIPQAATYTKIAEHDFITSPFNTPRVLNGNCIFSVAMTLSGNINNNCNAYLILKLRKWDGTTNTELGSVQTANKTNGASSKTTTSRFSLPISVTNISFKRLEMIKITIEQWAFVPISGGSGTLTVHHDPLGTAIGSGDNPTATTNFTSYLPFKIDL
jgi:hypothetical protein